MVLGADTPLGEIAQVTDKIGCEAVVLSGIVEPDNQVLESQLPGLVSSLDIPVFVGGQVSVNYIDQIMRAGAVALGADIDIGKKSLETALS